VLLNQLLSLGESLRLEAVVRVQFHGRLDPELRLARRLPVNRFPYHIAYLEWEGAIRILALAHDSREPGYWFSRINR